MSPSRFAPSAILLALALAGCPRPTTIGDGAVDTAVDAGDYDPIAGNPFVGNLSLDDERQRNLDPSGLPAGAAPCREPALARVTEIVDGDTVHVNGVTQVIDVNVRMIGIDTPEVAHSGMSAECYGDESALFTSNLDGRLVWLTFDEECFDMYGRLLAYVFVGGGAGDFWQRQLLRRGFARTFPFAPNLAYSAEFERDEALAVGEGAGRWSRCAP